MKSLSIENNIFFYIFRLNVCTSWWLEHLFLASCSSWLLLNWISSSRSKACHLSQGLLTITTGPTLSRRFRAKLITLLPFWLITVILAVATYHAVLLWEGYLLCLYFSQELFLFSSFLSFQVETLKVLLLSEPAVWLLSLVYPKQFNNAFSHI